MDNGTDLSLEVVPDEFEGVVEGVDSGELNLRAGLLLPSSLDNGGEDLVRLTGKDLRFLIDLYSMRDDQLHGRTSSTARAEVEG